MHLTDGDVERFIGGLRAEHQRLRYLYGGSDPRRGIAIQTERLVMDKLESRGYTVSKTPNNSSWDLWCSGVRVEVKAARWSGRYQANLRSNDADAVVLACIDSASVSFFVIPWAEVSGLRVIEIRSRIPSATLSRLARFYEAWDIIDRLVESPPVSKQQLKLF